VTLPTPEAMITQLVVFVCHVKTWNFIAASTHKDLSSHSGIVHECKPNSSLQASLAAPTAKLAHASVYSCDKLIYVPMYSCDHDAHFFFPQLNLLMHPSTHVINLFTYPCTHVLRYPCTQMMMRFAFLLPQPTITYVLIYSCSHEAHLSFHS